MKMYYIFLKIAIFEFFNWIIEILLNGFSVFIFNLFGSWLFVILFSLVFLIFLNYLMLSKKIKVKRKIIYNFLCLVFIVFFVLIPFYYGNRFNELKVLGIRIASCIEERTNQVGEVPKDKFTLIQDCISLKEIQDFEKYFRYDLPKKDTSNKLFYLEIHPPILSHHYYFYMESKKEFILID